MLTIATRKIGGQIQVLEALALKGQPEGEALCPSTDCGLALEPVSAFQRVGGVAVRAFFRHKRGAAGARPCWGAKGEGGLHFAAKLALRARLQELCARAGVLKVEQPCLRCAQGICHDVLKVEPSDAVTIEHWLDPRRTLKPDVVLSRAGVPLLSFEVRAAHPCPPKKIAAMTTAGAQMVEVEAWTLLGSKTVSAWTSATPLPLKQAVLPIGRQLCGSCQTAVDWEAACERQREEQRRRERERWQQWEAQRAREHKEQREREYQEQREREARRAQKLAAMAQQESQQQTKSLAEQPREQELFGSEVVAHCFLDLCKPAGIREELELIVERTKGAEQRAQLRERRKGRILREWSGKEVGNTDWLIGQARIVASATFKPELAAGCIVDPYGGFKVGPVSGSWPDPNYWWEAKTGRWIRARLRHLLAVEARLSENEVESRLPRDRFRRTEVRFKAPLRDFCAYEPTDGASFKDWLPTSS